MSDDDEDFFKIKQPRTMQYSEIDSIDSAVTALDKFAIAATHDNADDDSGSVDDDAVVKNENWWDMEDESVKESIRNRFVTGDWVAAQKYNSEVERRAHDVN